jgi:addiction module HigA family antidote
MTEYVAGRPNREPTHPGAVLREDVLPAIGLKTAEVAERLGITRQALHNILSEEAAVSPEMALRLGKFLGNGPELWIGMQKAYDLYHASKDIARDLQKIEPVAEDAAA